MPVHRAIDGSEPLRPVGHVGGSQQEQRVTRTSHLATGTLACPACDAPVAPPGGPLSPAHALGCPFCGHAAAVRDFLSLATPSRPARVEVRVVHPAR